MSTVKVLCVDNRTTGVGFSRLGCLSDAGMRQTPGRGRRRRISHKAPTCPPLLGGTSVRKTDHEADRDRAIETKARNAA